MRVVASLAGAFLLGLCACQGSVRYPVIAAVPRSGPDFQALVPAGTRVERLATGFAWSEGPAWRRSGGYLLFSDIPKNTIYRWSEREGLSVFLRPAGYIAHDPPPPGRELGTNGLKIDRQDRLVMMDDGNRQVARLDESDYTRVSLAARYQGKRLNSPNDLAIRSNGDIYFTDPPYGLKGQNADPAKELPFNGVYRLTPAGQLTLLTRDLTFPNGIVFSPDERTLYVSVSDPQHAVWMAYAVDGDGNLGPGRVLYDATPLVRQGLKGLPDGMTVDRNGYLFAAGPGGILVLAPDGRHLGTIALDQPTANCAWGDDGSTLYIASNMNLLRVRTTTRGVGF